MLFSFVTRNPLEFEESKWGLSDSLTQANPPWVVHVGGFDDGFGRESCSCVSHPFVVDPTYYSICKMVLVVSDSFSPQNCSN